MDFGSDRIDHVKIEATEIVSKNINDNRVRKSNPGVCS